MPRSIELLLCFAAMLALPAVALADDVLLATFEDETVGSAPVIPEVGSYYWSSGDHAIIEDNDGNLRLRSSDDSSDVGSLFGFQPTLTLERAVTTYLFRVESGATAGGGPNDFVQQLILSPSGTNLWIEWDAFNAHRGYGQLGVRIWAAGSESSHLSVSGYYWAFDTDYSVEIETDASTDRYALSIDGQPLVDDDLGANFDTLERLSFSSGSTTIAAQQIDDVRIAALPEPGSALCATAALVTLGWLGQRGRRQEPRAGARSRR